MSQPHRDNALPAAPVPPTDRPKPRKRPRELEDGLNFYLYHPLAWRLARVLAHTPVTPNMVSVLGAGFVVAAGIAYAQPSLLGIGWPLPALIGTALHMGWHVVDGADGDLARITGRASPIGEMVDGICDYASHTVLYLILAWLMVPALGGWAWPLVVIGGASHIVQANHVEACRRAYQWWVYDVPWLSQSHNREGAATRRGILGALAGVYLALAASTSRGIARVDAAMAGADADARESLRVAAYDEARPLLKPLWILGPNPRAIVLGLSMLAGSPLWYFVWQIIGLNLLMVRSVRRHDALAGVILGRAGLVG